MSFVDGPFYVNPNNSDAGANLKKLETTLGSLANTTTIMDAGTVGSKHSFLAKPLQTNNVSNDTRPATQGFGWKIDKTDMNSVVGATRFIPAANWTFTIALGATSLDNAVDIYIVYHKVDSGGIATELFRDSVTGQTVSVAPVQIAITASHSRVDFAANETLQIEIWVAFTGVAITGQKMSMTCNSNLDATSSKWNPALGIRTAYTQSITPPALVLLVSILKAIGKGISITEVTLSTLVKHSTLFRTLSPVVVISTSILKNISRPIPAQVISTIIKAYVTIETRLIPSGGGGGVATNTAKIVSAKPPTKRSGSGN